MRVQRGYTLIEALVVMALIAITTTFAIPSFESFLSRSRIDATAGEISSLLSLSRSEAIRRNRSVTVCAASSDISESCAGSNNDWSGRWLVFVDLNGDGARDASEPLIRVRDRISDRVTTMASASLGGLRFGPRGYLEGTTGLISFRIAASSTISDRGPLVCVSRLGRVQLVESGAC